MAWLGISGMTDFSTITSFTLPATEFQNPVNYFGKLIDKVLIVLYASIALQMENSPDNLGITDIVC